MIQILKNVCINETSNGLAAFVEDENGFTPVRTAEGTYPFTEVGNFNIIGTNIWTDSTNSDKQVIYIKGKYIMIEHPALEREE